MNLIDTMTLITDPETRKQNNNFESYLLTFIKFELPILVFKTKFSKHLLMFEKLVKENKRKKEKRPQSKLVIVISKRKEIAMTNCYTKDATQIFNKEKGDVHNRISMK